MEELSIEEKAKRYDEVLAMAKECLKDGTITSTATGYIETIFPELKESEDERIRKVLVELVKCNERCGYFMINNITTSAMLTWLEKQGEQLSAIRWYDVSLIPQEMEELLVEWDSEDATWHEIAFYHADTKTFWNGTRQVVGVTRWCYIIDLLEKQGEQKPFDYENANIQQKDFAPKEEPKFKVGDWINGYYTNYKVLSVNNEGYVVEDVDGNKINILFENEKFHHLWTIEDAKDGDVLATEDWVFIFKKINSKREPTCYCHYDIELGFFIDTNSYIATGSEIYPATKEQRDTLLKAMANAGYTFDFKKNELKKVKNKNPLLSDFFKAEYKRGKVDGQKLIEWSEEDEKLFKLSLENLTELKDRFGEDCGNVGKCINWLKSLKNRYTWKPSDEQMKILNEVLNFAANHENPHWNDYIFGTLNNLIRQLKKLKE